MLFECWKVISVVMLMKELLEGKAPKAAVVEQELKVSVADQHCREQVDEYNVRFYLRFFLVVL